MNANTIPEAPVQEEIEANAFNNAELERILVPVDFSATSRKVVLYAGRLAEKHGAKVALLHVVDFADIDRLALRLGPLSQERMEAAAAARTRALIDKLGRDELGEQIAHECDVIPGLAASTIVEKAGTWRADLIVIGTHSECVFKHMIIGSTAERVVRRAPCPVMVVRDKEHDFIVEADEIASTAISDSKPALTAETEKPPFNLRKILIPIDFSECSKNALQYAKPLADQFQAEIELVYVSTLNNLGIEGLAGTDLMTLRTNLKKGAKTQMSEIAVSHEFTDDAITFHTREGRAATEIVELAKERDIDLIVMATHGYSNINHVLLGSVAENVVRHATCPVLVVRENERESGQP